MLGAGTMGAQIAAHLANAGIPVRLLDVSDAVAREGLNARPGGQAGPVLHRRRRPPDHAPAGSTTDLPSLATADWIIEAVVERLDVKQALLAKIDALTGLKAIVSSNTSGIPVAALAAGTLRSVPSALPRDALLQSAALPAPARADSDRRHAAGDRRRGRPLRRPPSRQGRRHREGQPQLHRQSSRAVRRHPDHRGAGSGVHDRRGRHASPVRRSAGRRAPRSGRWTSPGSTCSRT